MKNLAPFLDLLTKERKNKLLDKVKKRTRFLTVVIEDVYQPHNASAILRTCDSFGVQDVYVIEKENKFRPNRGVSLGAEKWLNIFTSKDPKPRFFLAQSLKACQIFGLKKLILTLPSQCTAL